jgi:hypothetical protein
MPDFLVAVLIMALAAVLLSLVWTDIVADNWRRYRRGDNE